MRTASPTEDSDSMDVDLPAYRQVTPTQDAWNMVLITTGFLLSRESPIEFEVLLKAMKSALDEHFEKQPSNPFSEISLDELTAFVACNPELKQSLEQILEDYSQNQKDAVKNQLKTIYSFFINPFSAAQLSDRPDELMNSSMSTAEYSWKVHYVGDVAKALSSYLHGVANEATLNLYARYASIVQSSGTGKSRAVDEMSKEHFVIPINLRAPGTTGALPNHGARVGQWTRSGQW
ncbi:hypothetical protein EST38_g9302 [Candolleomyces aberdarensis]|uniref:Uncharacterized protein n=1 Tax=Candolleomyces aberdarensis TaxID=2316362 RepID=A0A4Q2DA89_9AGAR|nr:hypothetical protein EST38_g9302 [Candolleomyces aberdarensis]